MRAIYTLFLYLCTPFLILRLFIKSRRLPAYRERIGERFSIKKIPCSSVDVWIHAVSFGEVNAASALVQHFLDMHKKVLFTTMTPTGSQQVQKLFGNRVLHKYLPYDLPFSVRRFFQSVQPKVGIIMETELWPNLLYQAAQKKLPVFVANGRISDGAFRHYMYARHFFKPLLNQLTGVLAQSPDDVQKFIALGVEQSKVFMAGNLKFDIQISNHSTPDLSKLKKAWGEKRPVFIAASTHDNEEEQILKQLKTLKLSIPDILLLIAPRHPQRFKEVYDRACKMGYCTGQRSKEATISSQCDVVVIDTLGELNNLYSYCDYAFVGGSLVPVGGHNVLEPIACHVPVLTGPYNQNAKSIVRALLAANAMQVAPNVEALISSIVDLHQHPEKRNTQITNAERVLQENKGSLEKHLNIFKKYVINIQ